jgi:hypothetical protein
MKSFFFVMLTACFLPLWSVWAQIPDISPCEPCDKEEARNYDPIDTMIIGGVVGDCDVRIVYEKRFCGGCWDLHIRSVEPLAEGCGQFMPPPLGGSLTEKQQARLDYIITVAIGRMVFNNEMNFPPINKGDISCWRIIKPQCLSYYCYNNAIVAPLIADPDPHPDPDSAYVFKSCFGDTTRCCMNQMLVMRDECTILRHYDWPISSVQSSINSDFNDQYTRECPRCSRFCLNVCTEFLMRNYLYYDMNPWLFWTTSRPDTP